MEVRKMDKGETAQRKQDKEMIDVEIKKDTRQAIKSEIIETFKKNRATVDDLDFIAVWLMQKKDADKKHFLKNVPAQEVLSDEG